LNPGGLQQTPFLLATQNISLVSVLLQHEPLLQAGIACWQLKVGQEMAPVIGSVVQPFRFANRDCAQASLSRMFAPVQLCRMTPVSVPMIDAAHTNNPSFRANDRFSIDALRMSGPPRMCDVRP
jgi:hypothetical protein